MGKYPDINLLALQLIPINNFTGLLIALDRLFIITSWSFCNDMVVYLLILPNNNLTCLAWS